MNHFALDRPLHILSLGAGVQSSVVLLMSCHGELPKLDYAIFADTQAEPDEVYDHLAWLRDESERYGIPVVVVSAGDLKQDLFDGMNSTKNRYASIPAYESVSGSPIRRQCTAEYKIRPIETYIRRNILCLERGQHAKPDSVNLWMGISIDEKRRVRARDSAWQDKWYPLCGLPNGIHRPMNRLACVAWFNAHYPGRSLPRSSCVFCPFHSNAEWRKIKQSSHWDEICELDDKIRDGFSARGMVGKMYLHRSLKPLRDVNLEDETLDMFGSECLGGCGL